MSPPPFDAEKSPSSDPSSVTWTNQQSTQQSNSSAWSPFGDEKTQLPPYLHDELVLEPPKQQPTPQSCLSPCSLDMLLKSHCWGAYETQEWWLLH